MAEVGECLWGACGSRSTIDSNGTVAAMPSLHFGSSVMAARALAEGVRLAAPGAGPLFLSAARPLQRLESGARSQLRHAARGEVA